MDHKKEPTYLGDNEPMVAAVVLVAGAIGLVLVLVVSTGVGAHRRGYRLPLATVAALAFPLTWVVWYLQDCARQPHSAN